MKETSGALGILNGQIRDHKVGAMAQLHVRDYNVVNWKFLFERPKFVNITVQRQISEGSVLDGVYHIAQQAPSSIYGCVTAWGSTCTTGSFRCAWGQVTSSCHLHLQLKPTCQQQSQWGAPHLNEQSSSLAPKKSWCSNAIFKLYKVFIKCDSNICSS